MDREYDGPRNEQNDEIHPIFRPVGKDGHHREVPFEPSDSVVADKLAFYMGTIAPDFETPEDLWAWWRGVRTSLSEWMMVTRALRVHGLKIVNGSNPRGLKRGT
jgi:hypothetical protein